QLGHPLLSVAKICQYKATFNCSGTRSERSKTNFSSRATPHWLYSDLKNLISEQSFERAVAILYPQRLNLGRGGPHESAIGATGPGTRWDKRTGHHHGTRR